MHEMKTAKVTPVCASLSFLSSTTLSVQRLFLDERLLGIVAGPNCFQLRDQSREAKKKKKKKEIRKERFLDRFARCNEYRGEEERRRVQSADVVYWTIPRTSPRRDRCVENDDERSSLGRTEIPTALVKKRRERVQRKEKRKQWLLTVRINKSSRRRRGTNTRELFDRVYDRVGLFIPGLAERVDRMEIDGLALQKWKTTASCTEVLAERRAKPVARNFRENEKEFREARESHARQLPEIFNRCRC